jgi:P-type Cu2+ transporter
MDALRRCAHCGEPAPAGSPTAIIAGTPSPVCCVGCAAAANWIEHAGLEDYYRLRDRSGPRPSADTADYAAWLHPEVLAAHAVSVPGGLQITLLTDAMRCAACAWLIDRALHRIGGVLEATANAVTGRIRIAWDPARVALPHLLAQLHTLGFTPHLAQGAAFEATRRAQRRRDLLRLGVAGLGAMQAMMLAEAVYLDGRGEMSHATRDFFRWFTFVVATPVVFFSGWPFLHGLARDLRQRRLGMDALVGSSILLAYLGSLVETLRSGPQVWYDAAVMFVLLLLVARQLEQWARSRAREQVDLLARAQPALAWREKADGHEQVPLRQLRPDDVVRVAAGETVPADGIALAAGEFDEALLTGESRPVFHAAGEAVWAGSTCGVGSVRVRVTAVAERTYLSLLQRLVTQAQDARPRAARLADVLASRFVAIMFALASLVFVAWLQIDPARAFPVALAVLVVSCPCALALAIPTALSAAYAQLARQGVLTVRPDALEALARVDTVVFDKTGTLTRGRPQLASTTVLGDIDADAARALAAALQRGSAHPLARAFAPSAGAGERRAEHVRTHPGRGLEGAVDGVELRLGEATFAGAQQDDGAVWLGDGRRPIARFEIVDAPRPDAAAALGDLRSLGLATEMSSGDAADAVRRVAAGTGIDRFGFRQTPEQKLARVQALQRAGGCVLMVGDGLNDAPVLAGADVSMAFGAGAATAHRSADFVLTGDTLQRIPDAIRLARRARRIVRQNLAWALGYNLVALPFAAAGAMEPWVAALGMAASSLAVTLNALRLRTATGTPR